MIQYLDKRHKRLAYLPDARRVAVSRRRRMDCILSRPFGHWKVYNDGSYTWTCRICGAVGTFDMGYM